MPSKKSVHVSLNKGNGRKWKVTQNSEVLSILKKQQKKLEKVLPKKHIQNL